MENDKQHFINEQIKWHNRNHHGCLFATRMSQSPPDYDWYLTCLLDDSVSDVCKQLDSIIIKSINNPNVQALSVIIPSLNTYEKLDLFVDELRSFPNWTIIEKVSELTGERLIGINFKLQEFNENGENRILWILGFGPFDSFAPTRRSPYTELAMTVKSKQFFKEKYSRHSLSQHNIDSVDRDPKSKASDEGHLADIHLKDITDVSSNDKKFWKFTQSRKRKKLGIDIDKEATYQTSDTEKTKARVTLVLPKNNEI